MSDEMPAAVKEWHQLVARPESTRLRELLSADVVFRSPALPTPQVGQDRVHASLWAALAVLAPSLSYGEQWFGVDSAVLHFTAEVDGRHLEGVDIVRWDPSNRVTEFAVMIRPFKGLQTLMAALDRRLEPEGGDQSARLQPR
ncbi:hypothetical protein B5P44_09025 [Mycobacterium sp. CBMA 213]|nr:hypothetical protein [Mycolicibacterium sp. CBMA 213]